MLINCLNLSLFLTDISQFKMFKLPFLDYQGGIMRLFLGLMLVSFNIMAADWNDLEIKQKYRLTQSFQLPQLERSSSFVDFMEGEEVVLNEIIGLDMIKVVLFKFDYKNCPGSDMKTEMEIIPVKNTSPVVEVGAQLENCSLEIFIENKDLMSTSFFE